VEAPLRQFSSDFRFGVQRLLRSPSTYRSLSKSLAVLLTWVGHSMRLWPGGIDED
jgi:hypothetical protein